jgi:hypothetical protein
MADDATLHPEQIAAVVRAAAEGAAAGTAATIGAISKLEGSVLARLDEGNRRMGEMHTDVMTLSGRLDEVARQQAGDSKRIEALESARRSAATWLREAMGWLVAIGMGALYLVKH